jgi:preprotein translocase subunit SecE
VVSDDRSDADALHFCQASGSETAEPGGHRTAVVTRTRPQRPTGKRSRRGVDTDGLTGDESSSSAVEPSASAAEVKAGQAAVKPGKGKKAGKSRGPSVNPIGYVYNYLKQVVAELRKVIWPNRKQMMTYTSVVLAFLVFMVTLIGLVDLGVAKLVLLVFG